MTMEWDVPSADSPSRAAQEAPPIPSFKDSKELAQTIVGGHTDILRLIVEIDNKLIQQGLYTCSTITVQKYIDKFVEERIAHAKQLWQKERELDDWIAKRGGKEIQGGVDQNAKPWHPHGGRNT